MKVVLTCKLADSMDGVDVAAHQVGDVLDLTAAEARMLVAERWAIPDRRRRRGAAPAVERRRATLQHRVRVDDHGLERAS